MNAKVDGNTQSEFDAWCAYKGTLPKLTQIEQLQKTYELLLKDREYSSSRLVNVTGGGDVNGKIASVRARLFELQCKP